MKSSQGSPAAELPPVSSEARRPTAAITERKSSTDRLSDTTTMCETFGSSEDVIGLSSAAASRSVVALLMDRAASQARIDFSRSVVAARSEEHTSELQSLMRISYAVFCLKKKNK